MSLHVSFDPEIFEIKPQKKIVNETTHPGELDATLRETRYIPQGTTP